MKKKEVSINFKRFCSLSASLFFLALTHAFIFQAEAFASDVEIKKENENNSLKTESKTEKDALDSKSKDGANAGVKAEIASSHFIAEKKYHFEIFFNVGAGAKKVQAVFFDPLGYGFSFYVPIYEFEKDFTLAPNLHYFSSTAIDTVRNRSFVYENYLLGATAAANKLYKIDAKASVFLGMQKESSIALESDARFKSFYYFSSAAQLRADYSISENVYVGSGLDFYYSRARWLGLTVALGVVL